MKASPTPDSLRKLADPQNWTSVDEPPGFDMANALRQVADLFEGLGAQLVIAHNYVSLHSKCILELEARAETAEAKVEELKHEIGALKLQRASDAWD